MGILWLLIQGVCCYDVALVTFHGGDDKGEINNIRKYEFALHPDSFRYAGDLLDNQIATNLRSLRGMAYDSLSDKLYYVNAYQLDSKLLMATGVSSGTAFGEIVSTVNLQHPYGIAVSNGTIYVSNQGSKRITKFSLSNLGAAQPVFAQVGDPRGLAVDKHGNIWAADKTTNSVIRFGPNGKANLQVPVSWPIAVVIYNNLVFVTSRDGPRSVLTFDVNTGLPTNRTYSAPSLTTPCGVVVHEPTNSLYVMTQTPNLIHRFYYENRTYAGTVTEPLADVPQHILIVSFKDAIARIPVQSKKDKKKKDKKQKQDKKAKSG